MIRGVNKQIIEINSIESGYFEKAILFVRPEHSNIGQDKLELKANQLLQSLQNSRFPISNRQTKNKAVRNKRKRSLRTAVNIGFFTLLCGVVFILIRLL